MQYANSDEVCYVGTGCRCESGQRAVTLSTSSSTTAAIEKPRAAATIVRRAMDVDLSHTAQPSAPATLPPLLLALASSTLVFSAQPTTTRIASTLVLQASTSPAAASSPSAVTRASNASPTTAAASAHTTSPGSLLPSDGDLKLGIGLGIPCGALTLAVIFFIICRFSRRARQQQSGPTPVQSPHYWPDAPELAVKHPSFAGPPYQLPTRDSVEIVSPLELHPSNYHQHDTAELPYNQTRPAH